MPMTSEVFEKETHWFDIPFNIRNEILEMTDNDTQLSYYLCSDRSAKDMPEDFVLNLNIDDTWFRINLDDHLKIEQKPSKTHCTVFYCTKTWGSKQIFEEKVKGTPSEVVLKYFRRIVKNSTDLTHLSIKQRKFDYEKTNIKNLKSLSYLETHSRIDLLECGFLDFEQLKNITRTIKLVRTPLTLPELLELKAKHITIESMRFSSEDINAFLKCFVDGKVHKNVHNIILKMGSLMNQEEIIQGLNVTALRGLLPRFELVNPQQTAEFEFGEHFFTMLIFSDTGNAFDDIFDELRQLMVLVLAEIMEQNFQKLSISTGKKTEKKTEWFDLPSDIRLRIISMMDIDSKLSYLLCSDRCAADMPKNTFKTTRCSYSGRVLNFSEGWKSNTTLDFSQISHYAEVYKTDYPWRSEWGVVKNGSLTKLVSKYFQRIIGNTTNLEELKIREDFPFEFTSIKHLELSKELIIDTASEKVLSGGFLDVEQLYSISDFITISFHLTTSQLQQIKAKDITFKNVTFSSNDINQYLQLFIDGQINKNVQTINLKMDEGLDTTKMMNGLEIVKTCEQYEDEYSYFDDDLGFSMISKNGSRRVGIVRCRDQWFTWRIYSEKPKKGDWAAIDDENTFDVSDLLEEGYRF